MGPRDLPVCSIRNDLTIDHFSSIVSGWQVSCAAGIFAREQVAGDGSPATIRTGAGKASFPLPFVSNGVLRGLRPCLLRPFLRPCLLRRALCPRHVRHIPTNNILQAIQSSSRVPSPT